MSTSSNNTLTFVKAKNTQILTLSGVVVGLLLLSAYLGYGLVNAPRFLRVFTIDGLGPAYVTDMEVPPPIIIHDFAWRVFMQANNWATDGSVDFPRQIEALTPLISPYYRHQLEQKLAKLQGEPHKLRKRVRYFQLATGHRFDQQQVTAHSPQGPWVVRFTGHLTEHQQSILLGRYQVVFDLTVRAVDKNPEENRYGLEVDSETLIQSKQENET